jgi:hypothetical protein
MKRKNEIKKEKNLTKKLKLLGIMRIIRNIFEFNIRRILESNKFFKEIVKL